MGAINHSSTWQEMPTIQPSDIEGAAKHLYQLGKTKEQEKSPSCLEEAASLYLASAHLGNAKAAYKIGKHLLHTEFVVSFDPDMRVVKKPESKAIHWLKQAATNGIAKAHRELSRYYSMRCVQVHGQFFLTNSPEYIAACRARKALAQKSTSNLQAAIAKGDIKSMALCSKRIPLLTEAANSGNVEAMCTLLSQSKELENANDKIRTVLSFRDSLKGKDQKKFARISLAVANYFKNQKNQSAFFEFAKEAATAGNAQAMYSVSRYYLEDTPNKDATKAKEWLYKSAKAGCLQARVTLIGYCTSPTTVSSPEQYAEYREEAHQWARKLVTDGGDLYGTIIREAFSDFQTEQGSTDELWLDSGRMYKKGISTSAIALQKIYEQGIGIERDMRQALFFARKVRTAYGRDFEDNLKAR